MALIVEDGSNVANANSYSTVAEFVAYAASVGVNIPVGLSTEVELVKAAQFIDHHETNLKGTRNVRDQSMSFPRFGLQLEGWYWNANEIPRQVRQCQWAFALDVHAGIDLYNRPVNPNLVAKRERVEGAVDVTYAVVDGADQKATRTSTGDSLLRTLLNNSGLYVVELHR